jgi:hypothetical protein
MECNSKPLALNRNSISFEGLLDSAAHRWIQRV